MISRIMANRQIYPPPPGKPGFLQKLADDTKKLHEAYVKKNQIDPNILWLLGGLEAIAQHLALEEKARKK
jgi:hypothetical protein